MRTNCDKEFYNRTIKNSLFSKNIETTSPEQNGFIEKENRIIVESAKSILHAKKIVPLYLCSMMVTLYRQL